MNTLKDKHKDQTAWIVGKGPSLQYIQRHHLGEGIVITLNESILAVEKLNLPNTTYSLQKDGGDRRHGAKEHALTPECDYLNQCGNECGSMIRPKSAVLLLHDLESKYCFSDYPNRVIFDLGTIGLKANIHSLVFVTLIALYMGCNKFNFLCFDSSITGDSRTYIPGKGLSNNIVYGNQIGYLLQYLGDAENNWIMPLENE